MSTWSKNPSLFDAIKYAKHRFGYAIVESGQALERSGCILQGILSYTEKLSRHTSLLPNVDKAPEVASSAFVAPSALVSGETSVGSKSNLWYNAVLRSSTFPITVGSNVNIQDNAFVGAVGYFGYVNNKDVGPVVIHDNVSIGHGAVLQGCEIGEHSLIGIGAVVQETCKVNPFSIVAAGSVLEPGAEVPSGELWAGNPARKLRDITPAEREYLKELPKRYIELSQEHAEIIGMLKKKIADKGA